VVAEGLVILRPSTKAFEVRDGHRSGDGARALENSGFGPWEIV